MSSVFPVHRKCSSVRCLLWTPSFTTLAFHKTQFGWASILSCIPQYTFPWKEILLSPTVTHQITPCFGMIKPGLTFPRRGSNTNITLLFCLAKQLFWVTLPPSTKILCLHRSLLYWFPNYFGTTNSTDKFPLLFFKLCTCRAQQKWMWDLTEIHAEEATQALHSNSGWFKKGKGTLFVLEDTKAWGG